MELYLLSFLVACGVLFAPGYFYLRYRMTRKTANDHSVVFYTRSRVWKFSVFMLGVFTICMLFALNIMLAVKAHSVTTTLNEGELLALGLFCVAWLAVGYGGGFYISGILIEQYTMHTIKDEPGFSKLRIPIRLLHGPVSHILIFSGGMVVMLSIALMEMAGEGQILSNGATIAYVMLGIVLGLIYLVSQIKNLTWKHQLPWMLSISLIHLVLLLMVGKSLETMPLNTAFLCMEVVLVPGLIIWQVLSRAWGLKYTYK